MKVFARMSPVELNTYLSTLIGKCIVVEDRYKASDDFKIWTGKLLAVGMVTEGLEIKTDLWMEGGLNLNLSFGPDFDSYVSEFKLPVGNEV